MEMNIKIKVAGMMLENPDISREEVICKVACEASFLAECEYNAIIARHILSSAGVPEGFFNATMKDTSDLPRYDVGVICAFVLNEWKAARKAVME